MLTLSTYISPFTENVYWCIWQLADKTDTKRKSYVHMIGEGRVGKNRFADRVFHMVTLVDNCTHCLLSIDFETIYQVLNRMPRLTLIQLSSNQLSLDSFHNCLASVFNPTYYTVRRTRKAKVSLLYVSCFNQISFRSIISELQSYVGFKNRQ